MKRILKYSLLMLALVFAVLMLAYFIIFSTPMGLRWVAKIAPRFVTGLTIESVQGYFGRQFILYNVEFKNEAVDIKAAQVEIIWSPLRWFRKTGLIKQLNINRLDINFLPPPKITHEKHVKTQQTKQMLRRNYIQNSDIRDVNVYWHNEFKGELLKITSLIDDKGIYHVDLDLKKGHLQGTIDLSFTEYLAWQGQFVGRDVDTNYLWEQTNGLLDFHILSKGRWGSESQFIDVVMPSLKGTWQKKPINGQIDIHYDEYATLIRRLQLSWGDATIDIHGSIAKEWQIQWRVHVPDLHQLYPTLSGRIDSQGVINTVKEHPVLSGELSAYNLRFPQLSVNNVTGKLTSALTWDQPAKLLLLLQQVKVQNYQIPRMRIDTDVKRKNNDLLLVSLSQLSQNNKVTAEILFANIFTTYSWSNMQGRINVLMHDLSQFVTSPYIKQLTGIIRGTLNIRGTIDEPTISGDVALLNAGFYNPTLAISVRNVNVNARFKGRGPIAFTGSFTSGGGQGLVRGRYDFFQTQYPIQLSIQGSNLQLVNLKEYKVLASPNIVVTKHNGTIEITGTLTLPKVTIITDRYSRAVTMPPEIEIVGRKKTLANYFREYGFRLRLVLGNDIYLAYKNLQAKITGNLFLYQIPGGLPSGNGELQVISGTYQVYDKLFTIKGGRLIYVGNLLSNPGLSINAIRAIDPSHPSIFGFQLPGENPHRLSVGVSIQGTLEDPIVSLVSEPPMSQDDILSYIVFGQPRSNIGASSALSLLGSLSSNLNLEGPTLGDQPSPVGGFLGIFKMGLFNPAQILNFAWPLTPHWVLQTEASFNDTGVDLLYSYEAESFDPRNLF